jgi:hypothetical protein
MRNKVADIIIGQGSIRVYSNRVSARKYAMNMSGSKVGSCNYCKTNDVEVRNGMPLFVDGFGELCEECFKSLE